MRMPYVDRNILRFAVYEILFEPDVPDSVAINEAVEMAKAYGTDDSPEVRQWRARTDSRAARMRARAGPAAAASGEPVADEGGATEIETEGA